MSGPDGPPDEHAGPAHQGGDGHNDELSASQDLEAMSLLFCEWATPADAEAYDDL